MRYVAFCSLFMMVAVLGLLACPQAQADLSCPADYTQRLSIYNNCGDDVYTVVTPPTDAENYALWKTILETSGAVFMYTDWQNQAGDKLYRILIPKDTQVDFCVPDGGVASGNFRFLVGCTPPSTDDPTQDNWPHQCVIGGLPGSLGMGKGSLFEFSSGCKPGAACNTNPSDGTPLGETEYFDLSHVSGYDLPLSLEVKPNADGQDWKDLECSFEAMEAVVDLWDCPTENCDTLAANTDQYDNPEVCSGAELYFVNNDATLSGEDAGKSFRSGCMCPEQWIEPPGGQNPSQNTNVITVTGGTGTDPNIADWYACNLLPSAGADADPTTCQTPGCGGPQCAVGPLGTLGQYDTSSLAKGKGKPFTNYVKYLKAVGSSAYAWQFNDDASTMVCHKWGAKTHVVLGPGNAGQKPYLQQKWAFSNGKCMVDNQAGSYDTLLACTKDNFSFTCQTETVEKDVANSDPVIRVTADLNYCMPVAKGAPGSVTYDECMANNAQTCISTGKVPGQ